MEADPAQAKKATAAALAILARRDLSHAALAERLARKGFSAAAVSLACARCSEAGYLDDRRYGTARLRARLRRRPAGRLDATGDLRRQGLTTTMSESVVEAVYAEAGGEAAVLQEALRRWRARHGEPEDLAAAKKCFDHLMRRRFPRHLILQQLSPRLDELVG